MPPSAIIPYRYFIVRIGSTLTGIPRHHFTKKTLLCDVVGRKNRTYPATGMRVQVNDKTESMKKKKPALHRTLKKGLQC